MSDAPVPEPAATPAAPGPAPTPQPAAGAVAVAVAEPAATPVTDPVVAPTPPVAAPVVESAPRKEGRAVRVPMWLLGVLAVAVLVVGAFFLGRQTAPDSGPKSLADAVEQSAKGDLPVGQFDLATLVQALRQNPNLDLGVLGNLLGNSGR